MENCETTHHYAFGNVCKWNVHKSKNQVFCKLFVEYCDSQNTKRKAQDLVKSKAYSDSTTTMRFNFLFNFDLETY